MLTKQKRQQTKTKAIEKDWGGRSHAQAMGLIIPAIFGLNKNVFGMPCEAWVNLFAKFVILCTKM